MVLLVCLCETRGTRIALVLLLVSFFARLLDGPIWPNYSTIISFIIIVILVVWLVEHIRYEKTFSRVSWRTRTDMQKMQFSAAATTAFLDMTSRHRKPQKPEHLIGFVSTVITIVFSTVAVVLIHKIMTILKNLQWKRSDFFDALVRVIKRRSVRVEQQQEWHHRVRKVLISLVTK